jgi:hypothetical protein
MNPWMWLLWAVVAVVVLFVGSAILAGIWQGIRKPTPCRRCGYVDDGKLPDERRYLN